MVTIFSQRCSSPALRRCAVTALVAALVVTGLTSAYAQAPAAVRRGLIWTIERQGKTGWLVGSLHLLTADAYPLPPALDAAFLRADVLVEEADPSELTSPAGAMQLIAKAMNPPGTTLQTQVTPETYAKIAKKAAGLGLAMDGLDRLKPWMVALTLVGLEMQRGGFDPALGLDKHFLDRAPAAGKKVRTLETAIEQIEMLERLSPQLQDALVSATFDGAESEVTQVKRIAAAWSAGESQPIEKILLEGMKDAAPIYDALVVARNKRWVPQIEDCLATAKCFVVVGAAHLVGPDGLLAMLRARGFTLRQQ